MTFGRKIRQLREARPHSQRDLAGKVRVSFTYISKIEKAHLDFSDHLGEELILKLARVLEAEADELLILAKKIPESIRQRMIRRPDVFLKLASLNDERLDKNLEDL